MIGCDRKRHVPCKGVATWPWLWLGAIEHLRQWRGHSQLVLSKRSIKGVSNVPRTRPERIKRTISSTYIRQERYYPTNPPFHTTQTQQKCCKMYQIFPPGTPIFRGHWCSRCWARSARVGRGLRGPWFWVSKAMGDPQKLVSLYWKIHQNKLDENWGYHHFRKLPSVMMYAQFSSFFYRCRIVFPYIIYIYIHIIYIFMRWMHHKGLKLGGRCLVFA